MIDNMVIREFHQADIPALMDICLMTADGGGDATGKYSDRGFIGQRYALPYVMHSPQHCFVCELPGVLNAGPAPAGYILATPDSRDFYNWMEDYWLPPLRRRYPADMECISDLESRMVAYLHSNLREVDVPEAYPAHLHIDLLPPAQGTGAAYRLMERLTASLSDAGIPGVHLVVSKSNQRAVAFYLRAGFTPGHETASGIRMDMKL
jgi:ribosomal protein S18 acetylase RimI-like enzyme